MGEAAGRDSLSLATSSPMFTQHRQAYVEEDKEALVHITAQHNTPAAYVRLKRY